MVGRSEDEAEAERFHAASQRLGREIDLHAEIFEDIGAAALRGDRAVAVFHHDCAAGGEDEHARRRNVEEFHAIAARAADIDDRPGKPLKIKTGIYRE